MAVSYLRGDVTTPKVTGEKVIAHVCNDQGGFGKGVALSVAKKWPSAKSYYKRWHASKDHFELGQVQLVEVEYEEIWVANMVAQVGYKTASNPKPLSYEALRECLKKLAVEADARRATIHMPRIGTGLAGGSWDVIEPMIRETLGNEEVYIYDLT